jgi:hypothetical protein
MPPQRHEQHCVEPLLRPISAESEPRECSICVASQACGLVRVALYRCYQSTRDDGAGEHARVSCGLRPLESGTRDLRRLIDFPKLNEIGG